MCFTTSRYSLQRQMQRRADWQDRFRLHGRHTGEGLGEGLGLDTWAGPRVESALKELWGGGQEDSR